MPYYLLLKLFFPFSVLKLYEGNNHPGIISFYLGVYLSNGFSYGAEKIPEGTNRT